MSRVAPHVEQRLRVSEAQFAVAMSLLFALSLLAVYTGVAAIVGAFLAGLALARTPDRGCAIFPLASPNCWCPFFWRE